MPLHVLTSLCWYPEHPCTPQLHLSRQLGQPHPPPSPRPAIPELPAAAEAGWQFTAASRALASLRASLSREPLTARVAVGDGRAPEGRETPTPPPGCLFLLSFPARPRGAADYSLTTRRLFSIKGFSVWHQRTRSFQLRFSCPSRKQLFTGKSA